MKNKNILITGCSRGIGKYLTDEYLALGNKVVGISRSNIEFKHPNFVHFQCDVSDEKSVQNLILELRKNDLSQIDVLINNAGIASMNHSILTPGSTLTKIFGTNVFGTFYFSREIIKLMKKNNFGRIVNFSTVAVPLNLEGEAAYAASKAAVESLTRVMAKEVASMNVTVNAVGPTPIDTDLTKNVPKDKMALLINSQAIKRLGNFEDVKNVIDFFINENSSFITGQIVYLGGVM